MTATDPSLLRAVAALLIVLGLLAAAAWALRRWPVAAWTPRGRGPGARLAVIESIAVGPRHRLVLARCDGTEHLVLTTGEGAVALTHVADRRPGTAAS